MITLTEFLLARIAEDGEDLDFVSEVWNGEWGTQGDWERAKERQDRRLTLERDAKRRIIEIHETVEDSYDGDPCCFRCSADGEYPGRFPCDTMRALAAVYADHPDYQQEWEL